MTINRAEQTLQIGVASWLRAATIAPARFWFVPNGVGSFSVRAASIYKDMGLTAGIHDLHFIWPSPGAEGFPGYGTIEMKAPKARKDATTDGQKDFGRDMEAMGFPWAECRSLDEVLAVLTRWGYPLRTPKETVKHAFAKGIALKAMPTEAWR